MLLLVINPNSSEAVTENLRLTVKAPPGFSLAFYTAPASAPAEIDGPALSVLSEQAVLPDALFRNLLMQHDGFLVACYSDHPLIHSLARHTSRPVLGIMQATLLYSMARPAGRLLAVLTSTSGWNALLDEAIVKFGGSGTFPAQRFVKTSALDVGVLALSDTVHFAVIRAKVAALLKENPALDCVLLGCAGMAGLDERLGQEFGEVKFVDSVKAGVLFLAALASMA